MYPRYPVYCWCACVQCGTVVCAWQSTGPGGPSAWYWLILSAIVMSHQLWLLLPAQSHVIIVHDTHTYTYQDCISYHHTLIMINMMVVSAAYSPHTHQMWCASTTTTTLSIRYGTTPPHTRLCCETLVVTQWQYSHLDTHHFTPQCHQWFSAFMNYSQSARMRLQFNLWVKNMRCFIFYQSKLKWDGSNHITYIDFDRVTQI